MKQDRHICSETGLDKNIIGRGMLLPFILITSCFALWGFANDITNPMVKAFSKIFRMSVTEGSLVQVAFYGGYFAMAFPAAMFIRRYSYRTGVLVGLGLYAIGALMFLPARFTGCYYPFLLAYFILTCGLSFLETSCNPYILFMGPRETATRRLNLAQCFNPIGSLLGMYVAMNFIQNRLSPLGTDARAQLADAEFAVLRDSDLDVLIGPYLMIGMVIACIFVLIWFTSMPRSGEQGREGDLWPTLRRIFSCRPYREGVVAQFFYVGAQIMCWTFIIQYGTRVFMLQGLSEKEAEVLSQQYNIVAMCIFCAGRFICTFFLRYIKSSVLLAALAVAAAVLTCGIIFFQDVRGMYCLVAVSSCMSLMFPTIYGIALTSLSMASPIASPCNDTSCDAAVTSSASHDVAVLSSAASGDTKFGAAGLIMAILGGSVLPPLQAAIIDCGQIAGVPATNVSFVLPLLSFLMVALYAFRASSSCSS